MFDELSSERIVEIYNMNNEISFDNLIYYYKDPNLAPMNFIDFKGAMHVYSNIKMVKHQYKK